MSITKVERIPWEGRAAGYQASPNSALQITAAEVYLVETDSGNIDGFTVLLDSRLPQLSQPHPTNPLCVCLGRQAVQHSKAPKAWHVTITYGSGAQPRQPDDNPLARPPIIRWTSEPNQLVVYRAACAGCVDKDKNVLKARTNTTDLRAVVNAALDRFDPPLTDNNPDRIATITANVQSIPSWIDSLIGTTNDGNVQFQGVTFPEATLMIDPPEISELKTEAQVQFYEVTLRVKARKQGWDWMIPNMGTQCFNTDGDKVGCTNKGNPVSTAVNLDKDGKQMASNDPESATFMLFKRPRADFSVLRLPAR